MKKENSTAGITLVSLMVTILIMILIAGITITASLDSIQNAARTSFITELEMIQEKVNTIYEKRKLNKENVTYYDTLGQDLSFVEQSKLNVILYGKEEVGYRYFSKEDLKQLELDNMSQDVIINFDTRDVASITGIEIEGITYYRLTDIPDYRGQKIEYINKNTHAPTFDIEISKLPNSWQLIIKNIVYNSNVAEGTISYKLHSSGEWIIVGEKTYFEIFDERNI